jgi:tetratricopeptide (TPR) repeat protein
LPPRRIPIACVILSFSALAHASPAGDELVREARAHEAAHEDDVATRLYNEAITIDSSNGDAYLGLGALRLRLGDAREAERVYDVALDHVPSLREAQRGRARARWALGRRDEAEQDMRAVATFENDPAAWRNLAAWYGDEHKTPAQLATWRRLLAFAVQSSDAPLAREARSMVRALEILVGPADPASAPADSSPARLGLARIALRGG